MKGDPELDLQQMQAAGDNVLSVRLPLFPFLLSLNSVTDTSSKEADVRFPSESSMTDVQFISRKNKIMTRTKNRWPVTALAQDAVL
jgi:hypothetical protein